MTKSKKDSSQLSVATWNINSVRLRSPLVQKYLKKTSPDILCLQEIKCRDDQFPAKDFAKLGYEHQAVYGFKGYHGVAILSKIPFRSTERFDIAKQAEGRCIIAHLEGKKYEDVAIASVYLPAGGDIPDPKLNPKFQNKLDFLDDLAGWGHKLNKRFARSIVVGDLNVAPLEHDVWSHKQMLKIVSHTPIEVEKFETARKAGKFHDVMRAFVAADQKLYTWWSYRAADWLTSDRGRRLDHIWAGPDLHEAWAGMDILKDARGWERPSDHVPVRAVFNL
ncbi:MAG: exodeoxyribonuclease III [Pseudomonadota bacterium]